MTGGPIGRPRSANPRRNVVPIRYSDDELAAIRAAAEASGVTVGEWLRSKTVAAARRANSREPGLVVMDGKP